MRVPVADLTLARGARFSGCRHYRHVLWRSWEPSNGTVVFIGLNPSTADADRDDPTIRRCRGFAERWGYGALVMVNLFDARATLPAMLKRKRAPVSRINDRVLLGEAGAAGLVVSAWGGQGRHRDRAREVRLALQGAGIAPVCFGLGASGEPLHPLYQRLEAMPDVPLHT